MAEPSALPHFYRDDDQLVKIGYSKSERRTYEHRSPRAVLDRLAAVVAEVGAGGRRFTTEEILPPADRRLADVPSYQVYLCLAYLIRRGLVRRHGRAGYTIEGGQAGDLAGKVRVDWEALGGGEWADDQGLRCRRRASDEGTTAEFKSTGRWNVLAAQEGNGGVSM